MFLIEDEDSAYGLILEYGKYEEEYDVQIVVDENGKEKKNSVIYTLEKQGGLRYTSRLHIFLEM